MIDGVTISEIIWTGGSPHLSGLPHSPVPHLQVNRPFVSISHDRRDCEEIERIKSREKRLRESLGLRPDWRHYRCYSEILLHTFFDRLQILYEKYNKSKSFTFAKNAHCVSFTLLLLFRVLVKCVTNDHTFTEGNLYCVILVGPNKRLWLPGSKI